MSWKKLKTEKPFYAFNKHEAPTTFQAKSQDEARKKSLL